MSLLHWLNRPARLMSRLRYWAWEQRYPEKPWLCPGTVDFCELHVTPGMSGIEFGSGRSTLWFAKRLTHLTSIESDAVWYANLLSQLGDAKNVDLLYIPLEHSPSEPERAEYPAIPAYVSVVDALRDRSIGLALVDGHYRTHCVRHIVPKISCGGYLIVDDINLWPSLAELPVPASWQIVDDSTNGIKRCVIWQAD